MVPETVTAVQGQGDEASSSELAVGVFDRDALYVQTLHVQILQGERSTCTGTKTEVQCTS